MNWEQDFLSILLGDDAVKSGNSMLPKKGLNTHIREGDVRKGFKKVNQVLSIHLL
jgi:hypothetical protein